MQQVIGTSVAFLVAHLSRQQRARLLLAERTPAHDAAQSDRKRRRNYNHGIAVAIGTDLEQKRNIQQARPDTAPSHTAEKSPSRLSHKRMHDGLKRGNLVGGADDSTTKRLTVDRAIPDGLGPESGNFRYRGPAFRLKGMNDKIRIENGPARTAEKTCNRALACSHSASETQNAHDQSIVSISLSRKVSST